MKISSMLGSAFSKLKAAAGSFVHGVNLSQSEARSASLVAGSYLQAQRRTPNIAGHVRLCSR